jgi:lipopolysaccharide/colanic/teichoic acid biosynthesis glycosyltransferase
VLSPVLLVIAISVVVASGWPVIFSQQRIGRDGMPFTMYKFRTMAGSDDTARPRAPVVTDWDSYVFSLSGDKARTTKVGGFLRATGLDELPQLVNVVRGDMSLVGPRPEIPDLVEQYPAEFHRRHKVRPGMTGPAQVEGRRELTYGETLRYDLDYVDRHPLTRDVSILVRTIGTVLRRRE